MKIEKLASGRSKVLFFLSMSMVAVLILGGRAAFAEVTASEFLSTLKGEKFSIGGELEYEFIDAQNDGAEPEPHFVLDKFVLNPKLYLEDDIYLDVQLYFQPDDVSINELHIMFKNVFVEQAYVDIGLFEREIKNHSHRTTEGYPLIGTAFYRDDEYAVSVGWEWKYLYGSILIGDGLALGEKQVAEDESFEIIHDNNRDESFSGLSEFNINVGYRNDYGKLGKVDMLLFWVYKELSAADIEFLRDDVPGYDEGDDDGYRIGFGMDYRFRDLRLYCQYIDAEDGELDRRGWYIQPSYKLSVKDVKYFYAYEFLFRYGELYVDLENDPGSSLTWDRKKVTLALIADVYKNIRLKTEYCINDEKTGDGDVDNNELLVQLELKF